MVNRKKIKGDEFERVVFKLCEEYGLKTVRTRGSGSGLSKGDLVMHISIDDTLRTFVIECKNHKTLKIKEWWKELLNDCSAYTDATPILAFKMHGGSQPYFMVTAEEYLDLLDKGNYNKVVEEVCPKCKEFEEKKEIARLNYNRMKRGNKKKPNPPINI